LRRRLLIAGLFAVLLLLALLGLFIGSDR